jgi:hypothetical protein
MLLAVLGPADDTMTVKLGVTFPLLVLFSHTEPTKCKGESSAGNGERTRLIPMYYSEVALFIRLPAQFCICYNDKDKADHYQKRDDTRQRPACRCVLICV